LGFDCPRLVVAKLCQKHADSLSFLRLVPLSSLFRPFLPQSKGYDVYEIVSFMIVSIHFSVQMVMLLILTLTLAISIVIVIKVFRVYNVTRIIEVMRVTRIIRVIRVTRIIRVILVIRQSY
jgi:hypothetical protein